MDEAILYVQEADMQKFAHESKISQELDKDSVVEQVKPPSRMPMKLPYKMYDIF